MKPGGIKADNKHNQKCKIAKIVKVKSFVNLAVSQKTMQNHFLKGTVIIMLIGLVHLKATEEVLRLGFKSLLSILNSQLNLSKSIQIPQ